MKIFIHGLDSSSQGAKAKYFRSRYHDMLIPDFTGPLQERMARLKTLLHGQSDITLIGSSFGGLMASIYAIENAPPAIQIVLLAPALNFAEFMKYRGRKSDVPAIIYLGKYDTVTPLAEVRPAAEEIFTHLDFHVLEDDHLLRKTFHNINWRKILS